MADHNMPNRSSNMEKAEGERGSGSERTRNSERSKGREVQRNRYPQDDGDRAGGITNRPFDEEVENQEALPERGKSQDEERIRRNEDIER